MNKMLIFLLCVLLVGCAPATPSASLIQTSIAETLVSKPIVASTTLMVDEPAFTATQTRTPRPTNTPRPTATKIPTLTPPPPPAPISLVGSGDDVVEIDKWTEAAILHITHNGGGNFAVWNYGEEGERYDLLVNTIGNYEGTVLIDFLEGEITTMFEISAGGEWTIEVMPLETGYMTFANFPGSYEGGGDDVVWFEATSGIAEFNYSGGGNFAVWGFNNDGRDLLVNEIGPYNGKVLLQKDSYLIIVTAESTWSVEVGE